MKLAFSLILFKYTRDLPLQLTISVVSLYVQLTDKEPISSGLKKGKILQFSVRACVFCSIVVVIVLVCVLHESSILISACIQDDMEHTFQQKTEFGHSMKDGSNEIVH